MAKNTQKAGLVDDIPKVDNPTSVTKDPKKTAETKNVEAEKTKPEIKEQPKISKKETEQKTAVKENKKPAVLSGQSQTTAGSLTFSFKPGRKEKKTVRKGFLITESMNEKWKKLCEMYGENENRMFEQVLEQVFNNMDI